MSAEYRVGGQPVRRSARRFGLLLCVAPALGGGERMGGRIRKPQDLRGGTGPIVRNLPPPLLRHGNPVRPV